MSGIAAPQTSNLADVGRIGAKGKSLATQVFMIRQMWIGNGYGTKLNSNTTLHILGLSGGLLNTE